LNPEWKEFFTFDNIPNGNGRKMEFAVYDWDRSSKAEFMGGVYLPAPLLRKIGHHEEDVLCLRTRLVSRVSPGMHCSFILPSYYYEH
jgi:Ca2+-dependent lipid-binding protein